LIILASQTESKKLYELVTLPAGKSEEKKVASCQTISELPAS
jgi:hypothetical protein